MVTVLVTGSQGFLGSYICRDLLKNNYKVIGVDNFSKYGTISRSHDDHPNFSLITMDLAKLPGEGSSLDEWNECSPDYVICTAAMIGGIGYFHKYAYDLVSVNERILANTFDKIINQKDKCKRVIVLSSSMVFENTNIFPTKEEEILNCPPPISTYGFQKLSSEYFAKGALEQYGINYTIIRPFNCVGTGEQFVGEESEKLNLGHVMPSIAYKVLSNQSPLEILGSGNQVRCFTNGLDFARAVRLAMESESAINEDFNISIDDPMSVIDLAKLIWGKIRPDEEFSFKPTKAFEHDVQLRVADVSKAKRLLGFTAAISVEESVDEVISYVRKTYF